MSREADDLQQLWIHQPEEETFHMSVSDIRIRAQKFQSTIARRNLIEYSATAVVVAIFVIFAVRLPDPVVQVGAALVALGALVVAWNLHRQGRAASREEIANAGRSWAEFHRSELVRQHDALRGVWAWYLGPFIPGLALFMLGGALASAQTMPMALAFGAFGVATAIVVAVFVLVGWVNGKAAGGIQAQIDALDASR